MNEFPRLRARVEASEQRIEAFDQHVRHLEAVVIRLAEQINQMQQARKPGRKPKEHGTE